MKALGTLAISLALLAYGTTASAVESTSQIIKKQAPRGISAGFYACIDKADSQTIAQAACLTAEHAQQDARLNKVYKALMGKLQGAKKDDLVAAERAWLDLHNKSSAFEESLYGNETIANLEVSQNEIFRLCERANTLETYLDIANDQ